jgi:NitT/TauT family transport system substrate-binding protein
MGSGQFGFRAVSTALAAVAVLALGSAGASAADNKLVVARSSASGFNFDPLEIGIQQKIFEQAGVDVTETMLDGSAKLHQAMLAGAVDMGLGAGTDIAFLVKGSPEMAVGSITLGPELFVVMVGQDSPIKSIADLKGKRVGISTVGSLTQWLALQIVKKQGWTRDDINMITVGADGVAQAAALQTHQIDAVVGALGLGLQLEAQNRGKLLFPTSDVVTHFITNVIFASNKTLAEKPDAARAFLKGWYLTIDWMLKNKAESVKATRAIDGYSEEVDNQQFGYHHAGDVDRWEIPGRWRGDGAAILRRSRHPARGAGDVEIRDGKIPPREPLSGVLILY